MEAPSKPLRGVRVLELARTLAGPWMGQILADMGADVVKVERSRVGDETRGWGPPFVKDDTGESLFSAYFQACNHGKRSIEADFADPQGQELIRRLAANADIVIENFRVGTLARYRLNAEVMVSDNPRLIWCSISGFGQTGPYAQRAAYDFIIQAIGGLLSLNGSAESGPRSVPLPVSDLFAGLYGAIAALAALNRRHQTGMGTIVDLSLLDTQISAITQPIIGHILGDQIPGRHPYAEIVPKMVIATADGSVALVIASDRQFDRLVGSLGCVTLAQDKRFHDNDARCANLQDLAGELALLFRDISTSELVTRLAGLGVPVGPVNSLQDLVSDPHLQERQMFVRIPSPNGCSTAALAVRMPVLFDGQAALPESSAPRLGEHTFDVLSDPRWGG